MSLSLKIAFTLIILVDVAAGAFYAGVQYAIVNPPQDSLVPPSGTETSGPDGAVSGIMIDKKSRVFTLRLSDGTSQEVKVNDNTQIDFSKKFSAFSEIKNGSHVFVSLSGDVAQFITVEDPMPATSTPKTP